VKLTCQVIYATPVTYSILEQSGSGRSAVGIGYIKISNFEVGCCDYLKAAVAALKRDGATSVLLDVRGNPGGQIAELSSVLDYLLPRGDLFICRDREGRETTYSSDSSYVELPLVVIVNGKTENEAEMFALVMQNNGATVVGERTSGNGHNQVVQELTDGSAVRVSKYTYLTAERRELATLGGVVPDVRSSAIKDSSLDVILEAAKDVVS
jgi:carboxyl-terminal processing protease